MRQCPKCGKRFLESNARICDVDGAVLDLIVVSSERDRLVGTTILGRYEVVSALGDGGMGVVYRGRDTQTGRPCAIKVLRAEYSEEEDLVVRFEQEARAAASIQNPHIVEIYDWGSLPDNSRFFVMEYLEGQSLGEMLAKVEKAPGGERRLPLPEDFVIHIVSQVCEGLGAAHSIGVVHRDIKPDNFHLIARNGDPYFVKILDFGIAKVANSKAARTRTGSVFGTPHYMSPEQASGERNIDNTTDIYGLGVLMYEMVAGKIPFDADNLMGILTAHLYHTPVPPRTLPGVEISASFEAVILKCLAKAREARYATMEELLADLQLCTAGDESLALADQECNTVQFSRQQMPSDFAVSEERTVAIEVPSTIKPTPSAPPPSALATPIVASPSNPMGMAPMQQHRASMPGPPPGPAQPMMGRPASMNGFGQSPIQFVPAGARGFETPPGVSLSPATRSAPPSRSRWALFGGVVGLGTLLGVGGFLLVGRTESSGQPAPSVHTAAPTDDVVAPPDPTGIELRTELPSRVHVYRGRLDNEPLGDLTATTPLRIPRPTSPEVYRFVADGYTAAEIEMRGDTPSPAMVVLSRAVPEMAPALAPSTQPLVAPSVVAPATPSIDPAVEPAGDDRHHGARHGRRHDERPAGGHNTHAPAPSTAPAQTNTRPVSTDQHGLQNPWGT